MNKPFRIALALLALALIVTACGGPAATTAPASTAAPAATEDAEATAAPDLTEAPAATEGTASEPKILTARIVGDIRNLDPAFSPGYTDWAVATNVNQGLVAYEPGTWNVINVLAETIEQSDDGLTIDFTLREGIQFHGGFGELTAEDVKFSYERYIDEELNSPYRGDWEALDHVEVTGTYTGQIILKEPFAPLWTTTLPVPGGWILSKRALEENGLEWAATHAIGTGPYEMVEWRANEVSILKRNEAYWGERPYWDEIHIIPVVEDSAADIAVETGEIDFAEVAPGSAERFESNPNFGLQRVATLDFEFMAMNVQHPKLQDINVRQAIRYAIDVPSVIEGAHDGLWDRACAILPPGSLGYWADAPCYAQDLDMAREFMAAAGLETLDLTLHTSTAERDVAASEVIQAQLAEIGINVEIISEEGLDDMLFSPDVLNTLQLYFTSYSTQPDPSWSIVWFTCDQVGEWNLTENCNEELDRLYFEGLSELDSDRRNEIYVELQEVWDAEVDMIWVAYRTKFFAYRADLVPALTPHGHFMTWAFTEQ